MSTTVKKTITTALWIHDLPEGGRHIAYHGEVVELSPEEAERGDREGIFDQPGAGVVTAVTLSEPSLAPNFDGVYDAIAPHLPVEAEVVAPLHHDVQPLPVDSVDDDVDGGDEVPPRDANKPEVVAYVVKNLVHDDGTEYTKSEANKLNKDELWDLIDSVEEG